MVASRLANDRQIAMADAIACGNPSWPVTPNALKHKVGSLWRQML
ncbi:hypothetical protein BZL30_3143 [Mycobacterium kansasii]|uniref:Uncharacterized protein n=1 Tax=Mycobacterium kansasii TaxID=1768 RepID=A0A1V3X8M2_MYCKA|nr:hypothetical protein BZL30_3143 [Mycobacterium kansasii]